ncbi:serine hydrolase domain-containing protein [Streptomyces sp. NPDC054849]
MSATPAPNPTPTASHASRRALRAGAASLLLLVTGGVAAPAAASTPAAQAVQAAAFSAAGRQDDGRQDAPDRDHVTQDLDPATVARLDAAITAAMKKDAIPGVIVGLWMPGRGDYVKSFGVADRQSGTPMKSDLHMRIGSVTKTFTVTAVLQLVDQGRLKLDDPISNYVDKVPGGDRITLRQLAAMRSGLYDYTADPTFLEALRSDPQRAYTPQQLLDLAFAHPADRD